MMIDQPLEPQKRRRRYRLTPAGLASLRESASRVKPWEQSTGPRTADGKARSRQNALKHGERSAEALSQRAAVADLLRQIAAARKPETPRRAVD